MTPVFRVCDEYVRRWAALDPVAAGLAGLHEPFTAGTDYSPEGYRARADLIVGTLTALEAALGGGEAGPGMAATHPVNGDAGRSLPLGDRLAADYLRERLLAERAWLQSGEPLRLVRGFFGLGWYIARSVEVLPRDSDDGWRNVVARLTSVPQMLASWRASLDVGLAQCRPAALRQVLEVAEQATGHAGPASGADAGAGRHAPLVTEYGDGSLAGELAAAVAVAHEGYREMARYLREDYAPHAAAADGVGPERYAVEARLHIGADLDFRETYEWGWVELRRVQEELAAEIKRIDGGANVTETMAVLDESECVASAEAYRDWLDERHQWAIGELDGVHFDIPAPLRTLEVVLAPGASVPYYTAPSEDLTRPGRTWWPAGDQDRFPVWRAMPAICHEGVPGHHLQIGVVKAAGDTLSRFARTFDVAAHTEGWAMYAERLADELGWYSGRGARLGMLTLSALRAARLVSDLGLHLGFPLPDGSRWTFEKASEVIGALGHAEPHRVYSEVSRSCAWPSRLMSSLLGQRAWLAARDQAARQPGFDLKRWHTAALNLGPVGLAALPAALRDATA